MGQEAFEGGTTRDGMVGRLGQLWFAEDQPLLPEIEEISDDRRGGFADAQQRMRRGTLTTHGRPDLPELCHPLDCRRCRSQAPCNMHLVKLSPV